MVNFIDWLENMKNNKPKDERSDKEKFYGKKPYHTKGKANFYGIKAKRSFKDEFYNR